MNRGDSADRVQVDVDISFFRARARPRDPGRGGQPCRGCGLLLGLVVFPEQQRADDQHNGYGDNPDPAAPFAYQMIGRGVRAITSIRHGAFLWKMALIVPSAASAVT